VDPVRSRTRSHRAALKKKAENGAGGLRDRGQVVVETTVETLGPRIESARETLGPKLDTAREAAGQRLTEAGEWAAPRLDTAREQAVITVREKVAPAVSKAISNAAEASGPARKEAKVRTEAAIAALRGEVGPPKRRRRGHRIGFLLAAGAVTGALVALVVRRREPEYSTFEPTAMGTGPDPYARPVASDSPTPPITSMNEEIATDLTGGQLDATIDVTEEAVGDSAAASGSRQRKRTRGGQPE
jgi:hypothetical protein